MSKKGKGRNGCVKGAFVYIKGCCAPVDVCKGVCVRVLVCCVLLKVVCGGVMLCV